jgi:hypothetical protein
MLAVPELSPELDMKTVPGLGLSGASLMEGCLAAINDGWPWPPQAAIVDAIAKTPKDAEHGRPHHTTSARQRLTFFSASEL